MSCAYKTAEENQVERNSLDQTPNKMRKTAICRSLQQGCAYSPSTFEGTLGDHSYDLAVVGSTLQCPRFSQSRLSFFFGVSPDDKPPGPPMTDPDVWTESRDRTKRSAQERAVQYYDEGYWPPKSDKKTWQASKRDDEATYSGQWCEETKFQHIKHLLVAPHRVP